MSEDNQGPLNFLEGSLTLEGNEKNLEICGEHIRKGNLVAFPTETVYGLGANALDSNAIVKIFKAKERPMNDPLIVHVNSFESVKELISPSTSPHVLHFVKELTKKFWPGPLTIVLKCNLGVVPKEITGGTNNIGIRFPRHPLAQELIRISKRPIAAPSANKFGHVSPTTYKHVEEDLGNTQFPILIIKEEEEKCCKIGIESTVCHIFEKDSEDFKNTKIQFNILRKGGTSTHSLKKFINEMNDGKSPQKLKIELFIQSKEIQMDSEQKMNSPGQLITHYSPNIPTYMIENFVFEEEEKEKEKEKEESKRHKKKRNTCDLSSVVMIDFEKKFFSKKENFLEYFDFSAEGNSEEITNKLFKLLRVSEKVKNAKVIIIPFLKPFELEHLDACHDRLFRAASGRFCFLGEKEIYY